jgi:hypothetical protein
MRRGTASRVEFRAGPFGNSQAVRKPDTQAGPYWPHFLADVSETQFRTASRNAVQQLAVPSKSVQSKKPSFLLKGVNVILRTFCIFG